MLWFPPTGSEKSGSGIGKFEASCLYHLLIPMVVVLSLYGWINSHGTKYSQLHASFHGELYLVGSTWNGSLIVWKYGCHQTSYAIPLSLSLSMIPKQDCLITLWNTVVFFPSCSFSQLSLPHCYMTCGIFLVPHPKDIKQLGHWLVWADELWIEVTEPVPRRSFQS